MDFGIEFEPENSQNSHSDEKKQENDDSTISTHHKFNEDGLSPIHVVCQENNVSILKFMIDNDLFTSDINLQTNNEAKETPLMIAIKNYSLRGLHTLLRCCDDVDIFNICDGNRYNAMEIAAKSNHIEIIEELISNVKETTDYCGALDGHDMIEENENKIYCCFACLETGNVGTGNITGDDQTSGRKSTRCKECNYTICEDCVVVDNLYWILQSDSRNDFDEAVAQCSNLPKILGKVCCCLFGFWSVLV